MNKTVRLGILGMGTMGRYHAGKILSEGVNNLRLTAVCDTVADLSADFPDLKRFSDPDAFFASGEVDAVLIATPHYLHTELGIRALGAGLHVLVEKPISVHKADCERLLAAHTDPNLVFAAMLNMRTVGLYRKVKELLVNGDIGKVFRITWTVTDWFRSQAYYDSGGWRGTWKGEGGGVLLNQCPHQLDLWQWLFGMPQRVTSVIGIGRHHTLEVEDDVTALLEYEDGATGVFITSTGEAPGVNRLEISGDHGKLTIENGSIRFQRLRSSLKEFTKESKSRMDPPECWDITVPYTATQNQHLHIIKNFADAIVDQVPLLAPASEGMKSVELGNAMLLSGLKREQVTLPMDGAAFEALLESLIAESASKTTAVPNKACLEKGF